MNSSTRPLALVTGASAGIGVELARELAGHGHDLVLTARRTAPMEALADELRATGATVTVLAADLSKPGAAASLAHEIATRGLTIDVLINNAGLGGAGRFDKIEIGRTSEMLQVNIVGIDRAHPPDRAGHDRARSRQDHAGRLGRRLSAGPRMAVYFASSRPTC